MLAVAILAAQAFAAAPAAPADAVYLSGKVVTVDAAFSIAQAFAVRGDRLVAVGSNTDIDRYAGPQTQVIDLGGRTVLPGFVDSHAHVVSRRQAELRQPSLQGVQSLAEILWRIEEAARHAAPGEWLVTSPIGESPDYFGLPQNLVGGRWPDRHELDRVAPRNPVYIPGTDKWPYPSLFNSAALDLLGITRETPVSPEGTRVRIMKDADDEPTGQIYGLDQYNGRSPLRRRLLSLLPKPPPSFQTDAIRLSLRENATVGVTAFYEGHGGRPEYTEWLRSIRAAGDLTGRVVVAYDIPVERTLEEIDAWMAAASEARGAGTGDDLIKVQGVSLLVDGGPTQFGAAAMNERYLDAYGEWTNGELRIEPQKLTDIARLAAKHDLQLSVIAAGTAAGEMALQAFEAVNRDTPLAQRRWILQHIQHPTREQIARLKPLGVMAQTYSSVDFSKGAEIYQQRFPGTSLWRGVVPLRWWLDGGVTIAQSTDGAHYDPLFTLWESLVRIDGRTGKSLLSPAKRITREEAIRLYTINGARLLQWEDRIGSLEPGKLADFIVLDADILTVPVEQIRRLRVSATVLGGKPVYGRLP